MAIAEPRAERAVEAPHMVANGDRAPVPFSPPRLLDENGADAWGRVRPRMRALVATLIATALIVPLLRGEFWSFLSSLTLIYVLVGIGIVVLTGWSGQISFMQASFLGVGAYTTFLVEQRLGLPFPAALVLAGVAAAPVAMVVGLASLRLRGLALAIATLAFATILERVVFASATITSAAGFGGAPRVDHPTLGPLTLTTDRSFYPVVLAVTVAGLLAFRHVSRSRFALALVALRENPETAGALGVNVVKHRLLAFMVSGVVTGVAGALYAHLLGSFFSGYFSGGVSTNLLFTFVVAGMRSVPGAMVGAFMLVMQAELFVGSQLPTNLNQYVTIGLLLYVVFYEPRGVVGLMGRQVAWARRGGPGRLVVLAVAYASILLAALLADPAPGVALVILVVGIVAAAGALVVFRSQLGDEPPIEGVS